MTSAEKQLSADKKAGAPAATISADQRAVTSAKQNLTSTEARATASNHQASNQIVNAEHGVTSAKHNYTKQVAPASAAQIATDQAAVASAESTLTSAELAVQYATITAPVAGTVTAVNVAVGTNAPSGAAISLASAQLQVSADFTETDLPSLKVGQAAAVTIKAVGTTPVDGTVTDDRRPAGEHVRRGRLVRRDDEPHERPGDDPDGHERPGHGDPGAVGERARRPDGRPRRERRAPTRSSSSAATVRHRRLRSR